MEQNDNKYAPPNSRVADPEPVVLSQRPRQVEVAVKLIWLSLVIDVTANLISAITLTMQKGYKSPTAIAEDLIAQILAILIVVWCAIRMSRGKGLERVLFLLFTFICSILPTSLSILYPKSFGRLFSGWEGDFGISLYVDILRKVSLLFALVTLWLIFTKPGSEWFKTKST